MKYQQVTAEQCATWATMLNEGLLEFDVIVKPTSDVGRMIEALDWLGSSPGDASQPDAAWAADPKCARHAFPLFEQAIRIAEAVIVARGIPGARERVTKLKKRLNRLDTQDEQAQDFLFELEIGARLTRLGLVIMFDEPDIVLHTSQALGWDSRVSDRVMFGDCVNVSKRQRVRLPRSHTRALSSLGVEPLFHMSSDPKRPTITYLWRWPHG